MCGETKRDIPARVTPRPHQQSPTYLRLSHASIAARHLRSSVLHADSHLSEVRRPGQSARQLRTRSPGRVHRRHDRRVCAVQRVHAGRVRSGDAAQVSDRVRTGTAGTVTAN